MACAGVLRVYSSFQHRSGALVAVVGHYTLAPSVSISPVHHAECHEEMVVSRGLDASRVSFSERSRWLVVA